MIKSAVRFRLVIGVQEHFDNLNLQAFLAEDHIQDFLFLILGKPAESTVILLISGIIPCLCRFHIIKPETIPIRYFDPKIYLGRYIFDLLSLGIQSRK